MIAFRPFRRFRLATFMAASALLILALASRESQSAAIKWQPWRDGQFAEAQRSNRFVLLDLGAVWCHWCHVMEQKTWADASVAAYVNTHYIAVKVDQDSRPDLGKRYEDYGWPATIVFDAQGKEIVKLRGFIEPARMLSILEGIVKDPSPLEYIDNLRDNPTTLSATPLLGAELRDELTARFYRSHDFKLGGLNQAQKFMDRASMDLAFFLAAQGDQRAGDMAKQTLDGSLKLLDPVWGGAYQYSTDHDWDHPHYEKIMSFQADYLTLYANAWRKTGERRYLDGAHSIRRYVHSFLTSKEGVFYVSQDADLVQGEHSEGYFRLDDGGRRALGLPRVDTHVYARENGWMIAALAVLAQVDDDPSALQDARRAAAWIEQKRSLKGGGFRHDARDSAGPYLDDSLAMARAYLELYVTTAERVWLDKAMRTAQFIEKSFKGRDGGYNTAVQRDRIAPRPNVDENAQLAQLFIALSHYSGQPRFRKQAEHAMRYLATEEIATFRRTEPAILLTDMMMTRDPVHLTVVGSKRDPDAQRLYQAALQLPLPWRRIEWWDRREGKLPNADVNYPTLKQAAAFICTNKVCSSPLFAADEMDAALQRAALAN